MSVPTGRIWIIAILLLFVALPCHTKINEWYSQPLNGGALQMLNGVFDSKRGYAVTFTCYDGFIAAGLMAMEGTDLHRAESLLIFIKSKDDNVALSAPHLIYNERMNIYYSYDEEQNIRALNVLEKQAREGGEVVISVYEEHLKTPIREKLPPINPVNLLSGIKNCLSNH